MLPHHITFRIESNFLIIYIALFTSMIPAFVFICIIKCCVLKNSSINVCNILVVLTLYIMSFFAAGAFLLYKK
jgi:hypothetical protein